MKRRKREEFLNMLSVIAGVVFVYGVFTILGIGCPIKFVTGISCMGCGMTRAWLSILCFDLKSAFYYHPGFWIPPIVIVLMYLKYKKNIKNYKLFMFTVITIFVIIYIVRLIWLDNDIVVFHPENNLVSKILQKFIF